ncbi:hypothetical protein NYR55_03820 [Sphingomonas sp. BGYR3]|uniref:hypothetical protein n=1 Tax=Sphingomonas sp. BGYR3 TaxID=2975483 RepID=UPI0021A53C8F|nr:hypothetical protein [Sphingomonas sp. BGYR3]MDG5487753.1 hypothetical protein [Sphingomonas sp. BGYR3]
MIKIDSPFRRWMAAIGLMLVGGAAGAAATHALQPIAVMAPAKPIAISSLPSLASATFNPAIVAVKGRIAEVYGESFILEDGSGRLLIAQRKAQGFAPTVGQTVTVQGQMDGTMLRPMFIADTQGRAYATGRMGGRHGDRGRRFEGRGHSDLERAGGPAQPGLSSEAPQPAAPASLAN